MKKNFFALCALIGAFFLPTVQAQQAQDNRALPADINPETLARVGVVQRSELDEYGQGIYDQVIGSDRSEPLLGPGGVSMHMPRVAQAMDILNQYLRYDSVIGRRYIEVAILMAAREFDQQYEWSAHEPAALAEGISQTVIDVIKYRRSTEGLPAKESLIIRYGRELLGDHHLSSATWAEAIAIFGDQGAIEISAIMADYVLAGIILTAVDQQLPANRPALLPID